MATAAIPEGLQNSIAGFSGVCRVIASVSPLPRLPEESHALMGMSRRSWRPARRSSSPPRPTITSLKPVKPPWNKKLGYYNAAFQLKSMINRSNNDSWHLLMNAVGYPRLIQYAASIGITYDPQQNRLTPAEMALFLKQLYSGDMLNREDTEQLLSYMQNTNVERLIPAACRPDITVHHKYGQLNGNLHDVALLTFRETTYALAIYTESADSTDLAERIQMIHELTETIVDAVFPPSQPSG